VGVDQMERREFLALGAVAAVTAVLSPEPASAAPATPAPRWYDVKDYGAVGNGVVDDTKAVRRAIDAALAANGGVVWFPAGTYVTSTLTFHGGLTFQGVGWQSILRLKASTNANLIETPAGRANYYGVIRDLCLDGNRAQNTKGDALRLFAANYYRVEGVKITNAAGHAVAFAGTAAFPTIAPWLTNSFIAECNGNGVDTSGFVTDCKMHALDIGRCNKGVIIPNSSFLSDVTVWQCSTGVYGYWAANSHLLQVRAERCAYSGFRFDGCTDISVEQCRAYENNQGGGNGYGFQFNGTQAHPTSRISVVGCTAGLLNSGHEKQLCGFTDSASAFVDHLLVQGCAAFGNKKAGYQLSSANGNVIGANM